MGSSGAAAATRSSMLPAPQAAPACVSPFHSSATCMPFRARICVAYFHSREMQLLRHREVHTWPLHAESSHRPCPRACPCLCRFGTVRRMWVVFCRFGWLASSLATTAQAAALCRAVVWTVRTFLDVHMDRNSDTLSSISGIGRPQGAAVLGLIAGPSLGENPKHQNHAYK